MLKRVWQVVMSNWVFVISFLLAVVLVSLDRQPLTHYLGLHDIRVLLVLFTMMLISGGLERSGFLKAISVAFASRFKKAKRISAMLVLLTAVLSAFVTNDVALMVMVPFTIRIYMSAGVSPLWPVVFVTIAANMGSSITPFGNPQNIYIYSYYGVSLFSFVKTMIPLTVFSILLLVVSVYLFVPKGVLHIESKEHVKRWGWLYLSFFPLFLYGVIYNDIWFLAITIFLLSVVSLIYKDVWQDVDWMLLLTFVNFFFISGSITHMYNPEPLTSSKSVFLLSVMLSQVISNVPAATILADITPLWKPLLIGVSVGGVGTLIASMANLISYNIYVRRVGKDRYLWYFHIYSFSFLAILIAFMWFWV